MSVAAANQNCWLYSPVILLLHERFDVVWQLAISIKLGRHYITQVFAYKEIFLIIFFCIFVDVVMVLFLFFRLFVLHVCNVFLNTRKTKQYLMIIPSLMLQQWCCNQNGGGLRLKMLCNI